MHILQPGIPVDMSPIRAYPCLSFTVEPFMNAGYTME